MTDDDPRPGDDDGRPEAGGSAGPSDGRDDRRERADGGGETGRGFPEMGETSVEAEGVVDAPDFEGFDFETWLDRTEPREEPTAGAPSELEPAHEGFDFRRWMSGDDRVDGPQQPPETARVVVRHLSVPPLRK